MAKHMNVADRRASVFVSLFGVGLVFFMAWLVAIATGRDLPFGGNDMWLMRAVIYAGGWLLAWAFAWLRTRTRRARQAQAGDHDNL